MSGGNIPGWNVPGGIFRGGICLEPKVTCAVYPTTDCHIFKLRKNPLWMPLSFPNFVFVNFMKIALKALLAYLSPFSNKIVLFIKNLYFENGNKCFNAYDKSQLGF